MTADGENQLHSGTKKKCSELLVMCSISRLLPDMSSMAISFQAVLESVSPCQVIRQVEPALKVDPGPGSLGVTSPRTKKEEKASKAANARKAIILLLWKQKRGYLNGDCQRSNSDSLKLRGNFKGNERTGSKEWEGDRTVLVEWLTSFTCSSC